MKLETIRQVLAWCSVINYGILILWFIVFTFARAGLGRLHSRLMDVPVERINILNYQGMMIYKLLVLMFNLVPYLVLRLLV